MVTTVELISIALVTGVGSGIGNPIGQWLYKKYLEPRLDTAHEKVIAVKQKVTNAELNIPKFDTESKINEILGK